MRDWRDDFEKLWYPQKKDPQTLQTPIWAGGSGFDVSTIKDPLPIDTMEVQRSECKEH